MGKRLFSLTLFFCYLILSPLSAEISGLEGMTVIKKWEQLYPGIWRVVIGDLEGEMRYTNWQAAPGKANELNKREDRSFPFSGSGISFRHNKDGRLQVRIPTQADEAIFGFGLQLDGIRKSKTVLSLNVDHWSRGGGRTHAPVPFYLSSRKYGLLFNTARFLKVYVQIGNRKDSRANPEPLDRNPPEGQVVKGKRWSARPDSDAVEAHLTASGLEIIVFSGGNMLDIVAAYNLYCGGGALPPLWGLGFWHRVHARINADQTIAEKQQFHKYNFPLDVIGLEPGWMTSSYPCTYEWQKLRFPDPASFVSDLLDDGIRLNLWENPYVSPESGIYEALYPLAGSHLVWLGIVPDYTLPQARSILVEQHRRDHLDIGISGYKLDEVDGYDVWLWPDHATFPSGYSGEVMRQAYGLIVQKMFFEDLFKNFNRRTYGSVRASNAAASGYPFVLYSDSYSHSQYITGLSAASLSGLLWGPEVRSAKTGREWLNRMQTAAFSHLAMLNAWSSGEKPWSFPEVTDPVREVIQLRLRLLPYLYSAFADYHFRGIPPIRALLLEDTGAESDSGFQARDDQYMFGPSILVAPFNENFSRERPVFLPPGNWYDFYSGKLMGNNQTISVSSTGNRIPLFVREGALIPMLAGNINNTKEAYGHPLEIRHYGRTGGVFQLYEDDGTSFDYEKGKFRIRTLRVSIGKNQKLEGSEKITKRKPELFGKIKEWRFMSGRSKS